MRPIKRACVVGGPVLRIFNSLIICQRIKSARLLDKCMWKAPPQSMDAILPLPSLFFGFSRRFWGLTMPRAYTLDSSGPATCASW